MRLTGLDPENIAKRVIATTSKAAKPMSEAEQAKEARLQAKEARLAEGGGGGGSFPTPTVAMVSDRERSKMLDKLQLYKERFPHLKSRNKTLKSIDEIKDELHYVELQLGSSKAGSAVGGQAFVAVVSSIEQATQFYNPLNLRLEGLTSVVKMNLDEFTPLVDELSIKYGAGVVMPVEYRLMIALGATIFTVHQANSGNTKLAETMARMHEQVNVKPKHKDL